MTLVIGSFFESLLRCSAASPSTSWRKPYSFCLVWFKKKIATNFLIRTEKRKIGIQDPQSQQSCVWRMHTSAITDSDMQKQEQRDNLMHRHRSELQSDYNLICRSRRGERQKGKKNASTIPRKLPLQTEMLYPHVNCQHSLQTQQMLLLQVPGVVMQPSCARTKQRKPPQPEQH